MTLATYKQEFMNLDPLLRISKLIAIDPTDNSMILQETKVDDVVSKLAIEPKRKTTKLESVDTLQRTDTGKRLQSEQNSKKRKRTELDTDRNKKTGKRIKKCQESEPKVFSEDIRDMCTVKCRVCKEIVLSYHMDSHIKKLHRSLCGTYGSYDFVKKTYYRKN